MMKVAIITGASSGMGREFVREAARRGLADEIWAVARRTDRLSALSEEISVPLRPLALDLARGDAIDQIKTLLETEKPEVTLLVNAAGFGKFGMWDGLTREETDGMLDVNVRALVNLTVAALPYMPRGAQVLQVASCAAFQPLPGLNVYAATKAFVLRYTRALRWELIGRGIRMTAVCPGWVKTEFNQVARSTSSGAVTVKHYPFSITPRMVVRAAFAANALNLPVTSCFPTTFVQRVGTKILPDWVSMAFWELFRR